MILQLTFINLKINLVAPAADDWSMAQVTVPMSIALATGGLMAALLGKWRMRVGTRAGTYWLTKD